jgi:hypothetical protein
MPLAGAYRLDLDNSLPDGLFKLANDLADRCEHRTHRQREPIDATPSVLVVTHVVQSGVSDRSALLDAVELSAVIGQQQVVSALGCVRKEEAILLALPAELSRVVDPVCR